MIGALGIGNAEIGVRQRSNRRQQIKTIVWCLSHYSIDIFTRDRAFRRKSQGAGVTVCALAAGEEKTRSSHVSQTGTLAIDRLRHSLAWRGFSRSSWH